MMKSGVTGGKELAEKFRSYGKQVYTEQEQAIMQAGMIVERAAKINAPVDTGRLRASITTRMAETDNNTIIVEVGTSVKCLPKKNRANTVETNVDSGTFLCYNIAKGVILWKANEFELIAA